MEPETRLIRWILGLKGTAGKGGPVGAAGDPLSLIMISREKLFTSPGHPYKLALLSGVPESKQRGILEYWVNLPAFIPASKIF
jgi:hypothetical protein